MKSLLPLVALATLAACNQSAPGADKTQAAAAPAAPHSNAGPGTFILTGADGSMTTAFLKADGTYTDWVAGAMTESGKWAIEDNKTCFHPEKGAERCSADGPIGADGTYTSTPDQGPAYTVHKT
jgi:hypothetical protein